MLDRSRRGGMLAGMQKTVRAEVPELRRPWGLLWTALGSILLMVLSSIVDRFVPDSAPEWLSRATEWVQRNPTWPAAICGSVFLFCCWQIAKRRDGPAAIPVEPEQDAIERGLILLKSHVVEGLDEETDFSMFFSLVARNLLTGTTLSNLYTATSGIRDAPELTSNVVYLLEQLQLVGFVTQVDPRANYPDKVYILTEDGKEAWRRLQERQGLKSYGI